MSWEDIILEGLKSEVDLSTVLSKAAAVAPEAVKTILKGFPESIVHLDIDTEENKGKQTLLLIKYHFLSTTGKSFAEFPLEEQKNILENAAKASITASEIAFTLNEKELGIQYLMKAGNAFQNLRKFSQAEKVYNRALQHCQEISDSHPLCAMVLTNVGALYQNMSNFCKAEEFYTNALRKYESLEMTDPGAYTPYVAALLNNVGILCSDRDKYAEAEKNYKKALKRYRTLSKENPSYSSDVAMVLTHLGALYHTMGDFVKAEKIFQEALTIRRNLAQKNSEYNIDVAFTLNNLGNLYADMSRFSKAEKALQEALTIRRNLAQKNDVYISDVALTLTNIGLFYSDTGRFSEGEKALKEALTCFSSLAVSPANTPYYTAALIGMGALYWNVGNMVKAKEFYTKALKKYESLEITDPEAYTPHVAAALNNLGNIYWKAADLSKAEETYRKALEKYEILSEKDPDVYALYVGGVLHNLGVLYTDRDRFVEAQEAFEKAIAVREERALWMDLAETYNSLSSIDDRREDAVRLLELGILFSGEKRYKYAQKGRREEIYMDFLKKTDDPQKVFGVFEALRDADLLSLEWNIKITEKMRKNKKYQKVFAKKLTNRDVPPKAPHFHMLDDEAFLYVQKMEDTVLYLVATKGKMHLYSSPPEFVHYGEKLLVNLRMQIAGNRLEGDISSIVTKFDTIARKWTQTLPEEVKEILSEKDTIVFSPDAVISYFPLEGLFIDGEPICLSKNVLRATSMHQLQEIVSRTLTISSSLIVGNPWPSHDEKHLVYSHPYRIEIGCLEEAEEEARMLAEKLPNAKILLNASATAGEFLRELAVHSLIHFAGHGYLGRVLFLSGPMTSIPPEFEPEAFADLRKAWRNPNGNPIYMMDEWDIVTDIDILNTPLKEGTFVFLGACETGKHIYAGGGYYQGLAQAFLKNGASSVISSLIPLHGAPARNFAASYYDNLLSGQSVSTALQNTRKKMKEEYKAHIHWLPYIHYGSSRL